MDEASFEELLFSDPKKAFFELEKKGVTLDGLSGVELSRRMVKERYNLEPKNVDAAEFIFWISYFAERELRNMIFEIEKAVSKSRPVMLDAMLDRLSLGDKIKLIEDHYASTEADKNFTKMMWKINDLRNHLAHGRLDQLAYKGQHLSEIKSQLTLVIDLSQAALKK